MRKELLKELLSDLSDEDFSKVVACENVPDLLQLVKDEGFKLTKEQLIAIEAFISEQNEDY